MDNSLNSSKINQNWGGVLPYEEFTYTIQPLQKIDINRSYSFVKMLSVVGGSLSLSFGGNNTKVKITGAGIGFSLIDVFSILSVFNDSGSAITFTVALGFGNITDDRLVVSTALLVKDVGVNLTSIADFTTSTTTALAVPANPSRKEVMITNNSNSIIVYLGDSSINNTTRKGLKLDPLATAIINSSDDVYAVSASGSPTLSILSSEY